MSTYRERLGCKQTLMLQSEYTKQLGVQTENDHLEDTIGRLGKSHVRKVISLPNVPYATCSAGGGRPVSLLGKTCVQPLLSKQW